MKRLVLSLVMALACVAFLAPNAFSDTITFANTQYANGTGFGNVINVLSLQATPNETGSVTPTSVANGDAANTSKTWTAGQLTALGLSASNLGIVFNPNETGAGSPDTLDVQSFSLDFYNSSGGSLGHAVLTGVPTNIVPLNLGSGTSGWLMIYHNSTGLLTTFFSDNTNVLGGTGSIFNSDDGPDNFYLINTRVTPPPVPEPSALLLLGGGLVGLAVYGRKAFKR